MSVKLTNNATSLLAVLIDPIATALQIATADAGKFPNIVAGAGDWFPIVVVDSAANREVMRCTARSGVTLTVVRGQEGTVAQTFQPNARVDLRLTAQAIYEMNADAALLSTGIVSDDVLPPRLRTTPLVATDANTITVTGRYTTTLATTNIPSPAEVGYLWVDVLDSLDQYQEWQDANSNKRWARRFVGGVWGAWYRLYLSDAAPVGAIMDYAGATAPTSWMLCYGQAVLRATYPDLDTAIYCGSTLNATATFGYRCTSSATPTTTRSTSGTYIVLPDLRGRIAAGMDDMGGTSANRLTGATGSVNGDTLSAVGGAETHTLTTAQLASHTHTGTTDPGGTHSHGIYLWSDSNGASGHVRQEGTTAAGVTAATEAGGSHSHTFTTNATPATAGAAHNNVQPTIVVNKIIKVA